MFRIANVYRARSFDLSIRDDIEWKGKKRRNDRKRRKKRSNDTVEQKKIQENERPALCCQVVHDSYAAVPLTELHLSRFNCAELLTGSRRYGHRPRERILCLFSLDPCGVLITFRRVSKDRSVRNFIRAKFSPMVSREIPLCCR